MSVGQVAQPQQWPGNGQQPAQPVAPQQFAPQPPPPPVQQPPPQPQQPPAMAVPQQQPAVPLWPSDLLQQPQPGQQPGQPAQPQYEQQSVRDALQQRGFPVEQFPEDEQLLDYLVQQTVAASNIPQLQQLAQQAQAQQQGGAQQAATGQQPATPAKPAAKPYWDKPPEWDPQLENFLTEKNGVVQVRPEYVAVVDPSLPRRYMEFQDWRKRAVNKLLVDPAETIWPGVAEKAREIAREEIRQQQNEFEQRQFAQAFAADNDPWLYAHDAQGRRLSDPVTGRHVFSREGQVFGGLLQQAAMQGLSDPRASAQWAMMALPSALAQLGYVPQQPQQAPPAQPQMVPIEQLGMAQGQPGLQAGTPPAYPGFQPQQPPAQPQLPQSPNDRFLTNAMIQQLSAPGRGGSVAAASSPIPAGPPQNTLIDPRTMMTQLCQQLGITSTSP